MYRFFEIGHVSPDFRPAGREEKNEGKNHAQDHPLRGLPGIDQTGIINLVRSTSLREPGPVKTFNRRKEDRISEENKIVIGRFAPLPETGDNNSACALTMDISPGGVRIVTDLPLQPGARVPLELALSKTRKLITLTGQVRWAKKFLGEGLFEVGIEFINVTPNDRIVLLEYAYSWKKMKGEQE